MTSFPTTVDGKTASFDPFMSGAGNDARHLGRSGSMVVTRLELVKESCDQDEEGAGPAIVVSAAGRTAEKALASVATRALQAPYGGCRYNWRRAAADNVAGHLWVHIGEPCTQPPRQSSTGRAVFLDLGRTTLHSWGCHRSLPAEFLQARVARDIAEVNLLRGHVCVDFEDIAAVVPHVNGVAIATAGGSDRVTRACEGLRFSGDHGHDSGALVIITFPSGGGKLSESKRAMNLVREQVAPGANVIYATNVDADLMAGTVRITVLG